MKKDSSRIIGKTIAGVITTPVGPGRKPGMVMLQFSDGSCFEFVSASAMKVLQVEMLDQHRAVNDQMAPGNPDSQLAFRGV